MIHKGCDLVILLSLMLIVNRLVIPVCFPSLACSRSEPTTNLCSASYLDNRCEAAMVDQSRDLVALSAQSAHQQQEGSCCDEHQQDG